MVRMESLNEGNEGAGADSDGGLVGNFGRNRERVVMAVTPDGTGEFSMVFEPPLLEFQRAVDHTFWEVVAAGSAISPLDDEILPASSALQKVWG